MSRLPRAMAITLSGHCRFPSRGALFLLQSQKRPPRVKSAGIRSLSLVRKRQGRCYELAYKVLMDEPDVPGLLLVHGTVVEVRTRISHAWLMLPDGRAYDPVLKRYFSAREYVGRFEAIADRSYTPKEAAEAALHHKHFGPWVEDRDTKS